MFCNTLEDELHFVLKCDLTVNWQQPLPLYKYVRKQYIAKYFWGRPNMLKFIELLPSDRRSTICTPKIFVEKAFKLKKGICLWYHNSLKCSLMKHYWSVKFIRVQISVPG